MAFVYPGDGLVMRAMRERLAVSVDLGEQLCLDGVHGVGAVDPPCGRMVNLCDLRERPGELGGQPRFPLMPDEATAAVVHIYPRPAPPRCS